MSYTTNVAAEELLREQAVSLKNLGEYFLWEQQCDELIDCLGEQTSSKRIKLSVGYRHSMNAQMIRLEGLKQATRRRFVHIGGELNNLRLTWREIDTAFENRICTGAVINQIHIIPREFLQDASELVLKHVTNSIEKYHSVKVNTEFNAEFAAGDQRMHKSINTANVELYETSDLNEWYEERVIETTLASLDEFQDRDSGWTMVSILNLTININKYNPMRVGCNVKLPRKIMMKRATVNVKSTDNACFARAVVAALYPAESHTERPSSYPHYETVLNVRGLSFPITLDQIKKFEKLNDISMNVYTPVKDDIRPIRVSKNKKAKHVNLLLIEEQVGRQNVAHFVCIKDLSRLVSSQLKHGKKRVFICDR